MGVLIAALFLCLGTAEVFWPRAAAVASMRRRWFGNLSMFLIGCAISALPVVAILVVDPAPYWGLSLLGPAWFSVIAGVLLLDAWNYLVHRVMHTVPALWRIHAVHHSDPDLDITTTFRQHPFALLSDSLSLACVSLALGLPGLAIITYRVLQLAVQALAHANVALPAILSPLFVTPAFHRVHHSRDVQETNSNYGEVLALWDRVFGTARAPTPGPDRFGLESFSDDRAQDPDRLLLQPFLRRERAVSTAS